MAVKQLKAIREAARPAKTRQAKVAAGTVEPTTANDVLDALEAEGDEEGWSA